jgi:hypothetical protein
MLSLLILKGRNGNWSLVLSEFDLTSQSAKAIKGQVMSNLVTQYCGLEIAVVKPIPWTIFFDRSSCGVGAGIGNVLISPREESYEFPIPIGKSSKNNQVEYQAALKGSYRKECLELLKGYSISSRCIRLSADSCLGDTCQLLETRDSWLFETSIQERL